MIQHAAAGAATIKGSFQTGFNQRRNKSKQDGRKDFEPYIRSPPRVTNYGALLLGYVGCLFSARDGGRLRWTGMNLVLAPDLLLSLARQRGEG
jgi:hypothetical protein